jgi:hypothetical protein
MSLYQITRTQVPVSESYLAFLGLLELDKDLVYFFIWTAEVSFLVTANAISTAKAMLAKSNRSSTLNLESDPFLLS